MTPDVRDVPARPGSFRRVMVELLATHSPQVVSEATGVATATLVQWQNEQT